jgi:hypothetical protein
MKEYMTQVVGLVKQYVPPEPVKIQACQQAGKASLNKEVSPGVSELAFSDYAQPGDKLTLGFNAAAKAITPRQRQLLPRRAQRCGYFGRSLRRSSGRRQLSGGNQAYR